jgi:hypothetical protein
VWVSKSPSAEHARARSPQPAPYFLKVYKRAFAHIGLEPGARVQRLPSQVTGSRPRGTTPLTEREPFGLARLRRVGSRRGPRNGRADQEGRKGLGSSRLPYRDAGPAAFPPASPVYERVNPGQSTTTQESSQCTDLPPVPAARQLGLAVDSDRPQAEAAKARSGPSEFCLLTGLSLSGVRPSRVGLPRAHPGAS